MGINIFRVCFMTKDEMIKNKTIRAHLEDQLNAQYGRGGTIKQLFDWVAEFKGDGGAVFTVEEAQLFHESASPYIIMGPKLSSRTLTNGGEAIDYTIWQEWLEQFIGKPYYSVIFYKARL